MATTEFNAEGLGDIFIYALVLTSNDLGTSTVPAHRVRKAKIPGRSLRCLTPTTPPRDHSDQPWGHHSDQREWRRICIVSRLGFHLCNYCFKNGGVCYRKVGGDYGPYQTMYDMGDTKHGGVWTLSHTRTRVRTHIYLIVIGSSSEFFGFAISS